jgi:hypothetical protein
MSDLAQALMVAIRAHAGQQDKQGQPYLLHVLRVVEAVGDEAKVVAALHDALEDGGARAFNAIMHPGLSQKQRDTLGDLTRGEESYADYIERIDISGNDIAREVKLADLHDNLGRIPTRAENVGGNPSEALWEPLRRRYERAIKTLEAGGTT